MAAPPPERTPLTSGMTRITFSFEGRSLDGLQGDTIAAALLRNGVTVLGRSSKYHRPRGYRCGHGHCSCCAMRVDGLPGVRTCVTTLKPGMEVEREHAWPSAQHDILRGAEVLTPLMPPGFYYRWFCHSPRLFSAFERGLARVAGQGAMPSPEAAARSAKAGVEMRAVDVLVVGGGLAGISAALAAADDGAHVLLVERDSQLGGRYGDYLRLRHDHESLPVDVRGLPDLCAAVNSNGGIVVLTDAEAIGWYEENLIAVDMHPDLLVVEASAVVLATGAYELGQPFSNSDLPGVMLASGAQRLLGRHSVLPGRRAVFAASDDACYETALQLQEAGVEVRCLADSRPRHAIDEKLHHALKKRQIAVLPATKTVRAHGVQQVTAISLQDRHGRWTRLGCDLIVISAGFAAETQLHRQALSDGRYTLALPPSPAETRTREVELLLWTAGLVNGVRSPSAAAREGETCGHEAAARVTGEG